MLRNLVDKGKCALGFHAGDWFYQSGQGCRQIRICSRCKIESSQVVHVWRPWDFVAAGSCQMQRECERCQETEAKVEHRFGAPVYGEEGSCHQVRPCSRCNERQPADSVHVWDRWLYDEAGRCAQHSACSRCGELGSAIRVGHDWGGWQLSEFYGVPVRVCRRCAEMVFEDTGNLSLQKAHEICSEVVAAKDYAACFRSNREVLLNPVTTRYLKFESEQLAGTSRLTADVELCRSKGIEALFPPVVKAIPVADVELSGHWRSTEILGAGTSLSLPIDTHCILEQNGHMQFYTSSSRESGSWSVRGNVLTLNFDSGSKRDFEFVRQGKTLFCPRESRYRLWERIG